MHMLLDVAVEMCHRGHAGNGLNSGYATGTPSQRINIAFLSFLFPPPLFLTSR